MRRTITLPIAPDLPLTQTLHAHISDAQFQQAGVWQLHRVRIDLPLAIAQAARLEALPWLRLCQWLRQQGLTFQITGARRPDLGLHLEFEPFKIF